MTVSQLIELLDGYELEGKGGFEVGYWRKGFRPIEEVYEEEDNGGTYLVVAS